MRAHLAVCDRCRTEFDTLRGTVDLLRQLPELETPRSFALTESPLAVASRPRMAWTAGLAASAAGLLLVALLLGDLSGAVTQRKALGETPGVAAPLASTAEEAPAAVAVAVARESVTVDGGSKEETPVLERVVEQAADQAIEIERQVEKESELVVESEQSLTAVAPAAAMAAAEEPTPAPGLERSPPAARSPVARSKEEVATTPVTEAEARQTDSPSEAAKAAGLAPSFQTEPQTVQGPSGVSLPLWQLEVAAGAVAALLALVAVRVYRRNRQRSGY